MNTFDDFITKLKSDPNEAMAIVAGNPEHWKKEFLSKQSWSKFFAATNENNQHSAVQTIVFLIVSTADELIALWDIYASALLKIMRNYPDQALSLFTSIDLFIKLSKKNKHLATSLIKHRPDHVLNLINTFADFGRTKEIDSSIPLELSLHDASKIAEKITSLKELNQLGEINSRLPAIFCSNTQVFPRLITKLADLLGIKGSSLNYIYAHHQEHVLNLISTMDELQQLCNKEELIITQIYESAPDKLKQLVLADEANLEKLKDINIVIGIQLGLDLKTRPSKQSTNTAVPTNYVPISSSYSTSSAKTGSYQPTHFKPTMQAERHCKLSPNFFMNCCLIAGIGVAIYGLLALSWGFIVIGCLIALSAQGIKSHLEDVEKRKNFVIL